ncbi:DUF3347 domain-containing protein [Aquimarina algicola]|uniref:DUF3347 domain-containing protein n=1 Tax=Aquimarina algicola TaxID=2589995 RepID=A0A504IZC2_9FLAO|nr:DUF3347 domain-containing protein [Aquimarina algicola]TPN83464.1 DUF3347 domain-containing protein [Aquimarina algicola]
MRTIILIVALVLAFSCKNATQSPSKEVEEQVTTEPEIHSHARLEFEDDMTEMIFQHYLHIKTALVNSDVEEAQFGASMLKKNTNDEKLKQTVSKITNANDIEAQRTAFSEVTVLVEELVKKSLSSGEVYKQFCPMAFNNEGGYWLSPDKIIRNPYFGDKMLKCGQISETIQ